MANEATPLWDPADAVTCHAEAAVLGKRFVTISGPTVGGNIQVSQSGAGEKAFGIACADAAIATKFTVATEGIWPVIAGGALTAGQSVKPDAAGKAVPAVATNTASGIVVDDAADGDEAKVKLHIHSVPA